MEDVRLKAKYGWDNSNHRVYKTVRSFHDRIACGQTIIRSRVGEVIVAYGGLEVGQRYCLDFVEQALHDTGSVSSSNGFRQLILRGGDARSVFARVPRPLPDLFDEVLAAVPDADLVFVGVQSGHRVASRMLPQAFQIPMRVHFLIDVTESHQTVVAKLSKNVRRDVRYSMRDNSWQIGVDRSDSWFEHFFEGMYKPTMIARHGQRARVESKESAYHNIFTRGVPFYLSRNGRRVAGHFCHYDKRSRVMTSRLVGVENGDSKYYDSDVIKVMYFLMIEWACRADNVRTFDLQGSESFLSKPTYQMKRRLGAEVSLPPNHFAFKRVLIQVRADKPQVRRFLVDNPAVHICHQRGLHPVYFEEESAGADVRLRSGFGSAAATTIQLDDFFE